MEDASGRAEELLGRLHTRVSHEAPRAVGAITYSDVLGRRVRSGEWPDQTVSTLDKLVAAIDAGDFEQAAELADFYVDEAAVIHSIYRDWIPKLIDFIGARGADEAELSSINERILALVETPTAARSTRDACGASSRPRCAS